MNTIETPILIIAGFLFLCLGVYIGYRLVGTAFSRKLVNTGNALKLLTESKVEEWNAFRILMPDWRPDLHAANFRNVSLPEVNLRGALLDKTDFTNANLDNANFRMASAKAANFSGASLRHADFGEANLSLVDFSGAALDGASFKDAELDGAIVTSEQLEIAGETAQINPEELLRSVWEEEITLSQLDSYQFERLVREVMERLGYEIILSDRVDKGYDFIASWQDILSRSYAVVECKAYSNEKRVGLAAVYSVYSAKDTTEADRAILVTNTYFNNAVRDFASTHRDLVLIDRPALQGWVEDSGRDRFHFVGH